MECGCCFSKKTPKQCGFCFSKITPKHLCSQVFTYEVLKPLFLDVLYVTRPANSGELYVAVMKRITDNALFSESINISDTVVKYLIFFTNEFDVS